jgi:hypothetical protein
MRSRMRGLIDRPMPGVGKVYSLVLTWIWYPITARTMFGELVAKCEASTRIDEPVICYKCRT